MAPAGKMKGQYLIIEQTVLFAIGIIILTTTFVTFKLLEQRIADDSSEEQFQELASYVSGNVMQMHEYGGYLGKMIMTLEIPAKLANQFYVVSLNSEGVKVISTDRPDLQFTEGMYNINGTSALLSGNDVSTAKCLIIYKTGNSINIKK